MHACKILDQINIVNSNKVVEITIVMCDVEWMMEYLNFELIGKVWSSLRSSDQCKYLMITSLQRPDVGLPLLKWFRQVPHFIERNRTLNETLLLFSSAHIFVVSSFKRGYKICQRNFARPSRGLPRILWKLSRNMVASTVVLTLSVVELELAVPVAVGAAPLLPARGQRPLQPPATTQSTFCQYQHQQLQLQHHSEIVFLTWSTDPTSPCLHPSSAAFLSLSYKINILLIAS